MGKMSRTLMAGLFLVVLGVSVAAVAAWSALYRMPNESQGPGGTPPGGQPAAVAFLKNGTAWVSPELMQWGTFLAGQNKNFNFTVQNNGLSRLNVSILYDKSKLGVGWTYGYTMNNSFVNAQSVLKGRIWLNCSYSASAVNNFNSTVRVFE